MTVDLTIEEIGVVLESLEYSKMNVRDASGTPSTVREEKLREIDDVRHKLQEARRRLKAK